MIMDSMKRQPYTTAPRYQGFEDNIDPLSRELLLRDLPKAANKWFAYLTNNELFDCVNQAQIEIYGKISRINQEGEEYDLFCGELFDIIKDKVIEKQAYLVKKFNFEIKDEEIKSEVDDYLKRNKC